MTPDTMLPVGSLILNQDYSVPSTTLGAFLLSWSGSLTPCAQRDGVR
jgi:hypothetical protein